MSLLSTIHQLNQECEEKKDDLLKQREASLLEKRTVAKSMAVAKLLEDYQTKMTDSAKTLNKDDTPRKEAKLFEWSYSESVSFNGCFLLDLLKKGVLLEDLQKFMDEKEGKDNFKLYWVTLPKTVGYGKDRKYALFVSWNKDNWDQLDELTNKRRQPRVRKNEVVSDSMAPEQPNKNRRPIPKPRQKFQKPLENSSSGDEPEQKPKKFFRREPNGKQQRQPQQTKK